MAVSTVGGPLRKRGQGFVTRETLAQSTATAAQAVALTTDITHVGMGTATGFAVNVYSVAAGTEGQDKFILATATGEAKVVFTGTATGAWVLDAADDHLALRFFTGAWRVLSNGGATLATAT